MAEKILIVDDDQIFREELRESLDGYDVVEAGSAGECLQLLRKANQISLVILDVMMPDASGTEILSEIKKTDPDIGVIILTGFSTKDIAIEALKGKADDYMEKPIEAQVLRETVEKILAVKRGEPESDSGDTKGKINKIVRFVQKNRFKKITLHDAAESVFLNPKYLSRAFKEYTGTSFSEYKLKIKMDAARELLEKSGYNINQITDKLSYENSESFIRQFKKFTQLTPTEYRKKMQKEKSDSTHVKANVKKPKKR